MRIWTQAIYLRVDARNHNGEWGDETGKGGKPTNGVLMSQCCCQ